MSTRGSINSTGNADVVVNYSQINDPAEVKEPVVDDEEEEQESFMEQAKVAGAFLLWWVLSIAYNVYNKNVLLDINLPWTLAWIQFFVGVPVNLVMWGFKLRPMPVLSRDELLKLIPVATCHALTHVSGVIALGVKVTGSVSFTHIVKSMEPIVTAVFTGVMLGMFFQWPVYAAMIPIIGGVALASMHGEIGYSNLGFGMAMCSNTFAALRAVIAKKVMAKDSFTPDQHMTSANVYAVMTFLSTILFLPAVLIAEAPKWADEFATLDEPGTMKVILEAFASGFCYYYYNEVSFFCLSKVTPVTHAVGNTAKRVLVIGSAVWIFNTPMDTNGYIGSSIAVLGTLCYSLSTKKFKTTYRCECKEN